LQGEPLDFIVLCSSLASYMPAMGDVAYRSANAFLDAYAFRKSYADGVFTVSVNWDGVKEVGMTVETAKKVAENLGIEDYKILLRHEQDVLEPEDVPEVFERVLNAPTPNVLISTIELAPRMNKPSDKQPEAAPVAAETPDAPASANRSAACYDEVAQAIAKVFQEKLGVEAVGIADNYFDLGVDSLTLVQIYSVLNNMYPGVLNVHHLFESRTIRNLAQLVVSQMQTEVQEDRETDTAVNMIEF
jgi:phthiocerol/phenolphthiocerol synthesis type-I polyketide synthase E